MLDQIPGVAVRIRKDGNSAVDLATRCFEKAYAAASHRGMLGGEIVRLQEKANPAAGLTHCFLRLANLSNYALDRLSRYEATLWRQVGQTLFALAALCTSRPTRSKRSNKEFNAGVAESSERQSLGRVNSTRNGFVLQTLLHEHLGAEGPPAAGRVS